MLLIYLLRLRHKQVQPPVRPPQRLDGLPPFQYERGHDGRPLGRVAAPPTVDVSSTKPGTTRETTHTDDPSALALLGSKGSEK